MTARTARNIQLMAWSVLLAAFGVFLTLAFGGPRAVGHYLRVATAAREASVEVPTGDVELCASRCARFPAGSDAMATEGTEIRPLGGTVSKAIVRFYEGSQVTVEDNGRLILVHMRQPRYQWGTAPESVRLRFRREEHADPGSTAVLRVGTRYAREDDPPRRFVIDTPHAVVDVAPDSHARLELTEEALRVYGEMGAVTVTGKGAMLTADASSADRSVTVGAGERTAVRVDGIPAPAVADPENLLSNGDFGDALGTGGWQRVPPPPVEIVSPPTAGVVRTDDDRSVLDMRRDDARKSPADIVVRHDLEDFSLGDASFLAVTATLRVREQSLPGGGDKAEEFPLLLNLIAVDVSGDEFTWSVGFYARPPDPDAQEFAQAQVNPRRDVQVPFDQWVDFDSGNLLERDNPLAFAQMPMPREAVRLKRIEIKASGHDFHSQLDAVRVLWR